MLVGHTDNTGSERHNNALSAERAQAVAKVLKDLGVRDEQLVIQGASFQQPLDNNTTTDGRARNRRVDLQLP